MEFRKRINPDLPFYYYTCAHDRYYEDVMPDFNTKPAKPTMSRRMLKKHSTSSEVNDRGCSGGMPCCALKVSLQFLDSTSAIKATNTSLVKP